MTGFFYPANSIIHKLPAGLKLVFLVVLGTLIFQVERLDVLIGLLGVIALLVIAAKLPLKIVWRQLKPAIWVLAFIFAIQFLMIGWEVATFIVLRFAVLILAAGIVTVTTKVSDLVAAIETVLRPFRKWVSPEKVSMAITLAIRFIPLLASITEEVRAAQKVRGNDRNMLAILVPVIVRTLKMATEVAEALDARSFGAKATHRVTK
ncbi:energy-coupling factor transporter transmembrane component T family protein [Sneathiella limimaris]|uniref:energy-coupling factor transporter transmembrane component T family protein n=1 Tax=Sneathiella limimaris TaxID=1964213 RepID=UPI00146E9C10|nr:energy-coupling factor transporter transmembrane component T [Sneathiella limimaris]